MAKVSNTIIYPQDVNLSMLDYLLGTNSNTGNKKTQTYSLGSIFSLFYNFLGFNAFLFTTDTTTYPIGTPGCFFVFDENNDLTNDFSESRKITFSATDTYNFNVAEYFGIVVNSGKFLFKLINLEDKNNFVFLSPSNFFLGETGTTFDVDVLAEVGLSNGNFVNYKRYLLVLEFATGAFNPSDYDLSDFANTSGNQFVRQDALDLKLNISDYNDRFKGKYTSLVNLQVAHPTSNTGDYSIVDSGLGSNAIEYIYDEEEGWVQGNSVSSSTTDGLVEGSSNLYFTTARVLATVLSGLSLVTGGEIVSTDSILVAFGKIQKQINEKQDKIIIVSASVTADNDKKYYVVSNAIFTDPASPVEGKGYEVFVRSGIATIGGVDYPVGSYVFRTYHSGTWNNQLIGGGAQPFTFEIPIFFFNRSVETYFYHKGTAVGYVNFTSSSGQVNHGLLVPNSNSAIYRVPRNAKIDKIYMLTNGATFDISIWQSDDINGTNAVEIYYSAGNFNNLELNNANIDVIEDNFLHIFLRNQLASNGANNARLFMKFI